MVVGIFDRETDGKERAVLCLTEVTFFWEGAIFTGPISTPFLEKALSSCLAKEDTISYLVFRISVFCLKDQRAF
jgi:hypothetical protein